MPPEETTDTSAGASLERSSDKLNTVVSGLNVSIDKLSGILGSMGGGAGSSGSIAIGGLSFEEFTKAAEKAKGDINKLWATISKGQSDISLASATRQFSSFSSGATGAFANITKAAGSMMNFVERHAGKLGEVLGAAGIIGSAKFQKAIIEKLGDATGYNMAQKHLMEVQKQALQMGVAFDGALGDAESNFNFFNRSLRESSMVTRSMPEAVLEVQKALGATFGATGVVQNLGTMARAQDNIRSSLTATNAALLVNKATGADVSRITELMNVAHTELGESIEGSVLAFGRISEAAKGSGIGFDRTMQSIKESAQALRMWGGTIGAVSPLFEMFSRSLKGTGREGLTPQLLQSFVGGLNQMTTSTKALMGIQAGMGGRGGAIGAALEIEQAMEQGPEGMKKVVDSLQQTLTQFGGGRILTRAEAVADPAAQANFLLQRQLLGKMLGMDEATATKTLDALSKIQDTGLQTGSDAEGALGELLGSGEKIADNTTTTMEKLSIQEVNAINAGARDIIGAVQGLADKLDIGSFARGIDTALEQAIISGQVNPEDIARQLTRATRERDVAKERVQEARVAGRAPSQRQVAELSRAEQRVEELRASKDLQRLLPRQMAEAMERGRMTGPETMAAVTTGQVPPRIAEEALAGVTQQNTELLNQIGSKISQGKASPEEVRMFNLMGGAFENLNNTISAGIQIQPSDLRVSTDTSSLERAAGDLRASRETTMPAPLPLPPAPELPPIPEVTMTEAPAGAIQPEIPMVRPELPVPAQDRGDSNRFLSPPMPPLQLPSVDRPQKIKEMVTREFPRATPTPIALPQIDGNARRMASPADTRQQINQNMLQALNVKTLNADELFVSSDLEKALRGADETSRRPQTREMINVITPERRELPVAASINAANTARREAVEVPTAQAVPAQQVAAGARPQQAEVFIKVTMQGDTTIRLEPVVRKIVNDMYREN